MCPHLVEEGHVALVAALETLLFHRIANLIVAKFKPPAPMGTAMGQQGGLVGPQFSRRAYMRMAIDDLHVIPLVIRYKKTLIYKFGACAPKLRQST
jgi:hypothetical protein